jgi:hypothetical protein
MMSGWSAGSTADDDWSTGSTVDVDWSIANAWSTDATVEEMADTLWYCGGYITRATSDAIAEALMAYGWTTGAIASQGIAATFSSRAEAYEICVELLAYADEVRNNLSRPLPPPSTEGGRRRYKSSAPPSWLIRQHPDQPAAPGGYPEDATAYVSYACQQLRERCSSQGWSSSSGIYRRSPEEPPFYHDRMLIEADLDDIVLRSYDPNVITPPSPHLPWEGSWWRCASHIVALARQTTLQSSAKTPSPETDLQDFMIQHILRLIQRVVDLPCNRSWSVRATGLHSAFSLPEVRYTLLCAATTTQLAIFGRQMLCTSSDAKQQMLFTSSDAEASYFLALSRRLLDITERKLEVLQRTRFYIDDYGLVSNFVTSQQVFVSARKSIYALAAAIRDGCPTQQRNVVLQHSLAYRREQERKMAASTLRRWFSVVVFRRRLEKCRQRRFLLRQRCKGASAYAKMLQSTRCDDRRPTPSPPVMLDNNNPAPKMAPYPSPESRHPFRTRGSQLPPKKDKWCLGSCRQRRLRRLLLFRSSSGKVHATPIPSSRVDRPANTVDDTARPVDAVFDGLQQVAHILSTLPLSKLSDDQRNQIKSSPDWLQLCSSVIELQVGIPLRAPFKKSLRDEHTPLPSSLTHSEFFLEDRGGEISTTTRGGTTITSYVVNDDFG